MILFFFFFLGARDELSGWTEGRALWCHVGISCYAMLCAETAVMVGDIRAMYSA